ncbi:NeuD/PglB/VioB family sugar acetyltransferase [bacterium]|jgi:sugar O-acyltransferase (sialic acid O-acetyltransferase NeuD family)|nr:NeuD/PglB/VioB family sugar acetyltransferase [bacterium]
MDNIILIGGGNQAHYTIDIINRVGKYNIVGIVDSTHPTGTERFGYKVIGRQEDLQSLIGQYNIQGGVISIGDNWIRYHIYNQILELVPDFKFVNAIHPSVIIGDNVKLGNGIIAMAGVIFNPKSQIGNLTFFATGAQIEHDCIIDDFASISAGSTLGGHVHIKQFAAITLNVTIVDRVSIGENSVIGAASLVTRSIRDNVLAYGNPAREIRDRKQGERFLK